MIPVRLTVHNFLPYRDAQTLDFTGIHTATICGDNGAGKSSIIDAITWALWGETRARRDIELIHQGQQEAEVDLEFEVGGQRYRVIRRRALPKRAGAAAQSMLHLQVVSDAGYRSIDGDTASQTQQKITSEILHMDYDTFINSAYLRQGHADEFTTANPAKRKQVLANILKLDEYDALSDRAKERANALKAERDKLTYMLGNLDMELMSLPQCEADLQAAQAELTALDESARVHETSLNGLRQQKEALESKRSQLTQLDATISQNKRHLLQLETQATSVHARISEHEAVLARREEIAAGHATFTAARDADAAMSKQLTQLTRLSQRKHELEMAVERQSQELSRDHARAQARLTELEKTAGKLPALREELAGVRQVLERLGKQEDALKLKKLAQQEMLAGIRNMESERGRLQKEIEDIGEKLRLLKTEKGATCPLCGCPLGVDGLKHIESEFAAQRQAKADGMRASQAAAQVKQAELKQLTEHIQVEEYNLSREKAAALGRIGAFEREAAMAEEAARNVSGTRETLRDMEERLTTRAFAAEHIALLQKVEEAITALGYDTQKHEQLRQECENYRRFEALKVRLDDADRHIVPEREDAARLDTMVQEVETSVRADAEQRQTLVAELEVYPRVAADLSKADAEYRSAVTRQREAQGRVGGIKTRLEHLHQLGVTRQEQKKALDQATRDESIYRELVEAFGKKGVQALIIETAVPEIESKANELLARMTEGRMTVRIKTQDVTLDGRPTETFDIEIADELGTRNYEMFSGGEAFRINFAIRVALSRLVARRAGAPLQTLIIDEGFGTQDAAGIEKLREAITTIQDDFEKILVITHIEEFKDAFPARIEVTKEADGSKIRLG